MTVLVSAKIHKKWFFGLSCKQKIGVNKFWVRLKNKAEKSRQKLAIKICREIFLSVANQNFLSLGCIAKKALFDKLAHKARAPKKTL